MASRRAQLLSVDPVHPEPHRIGQAIARLKAEELVVYPSGSIYGIGGLLHSKTVMTGIYALRKLDAKKPLSVICSDLSEASQYAIIGNDCHRLMRRLLPGPYTFILPATRDVPKMGDKQRRTVGIRIPEHPVAQALVARLGQPLLSASAIVPGQEDDVSDPRALAEYYSHGVGLVLDAGILLGAPSSVIDWTGDAPVVVRAAAGDVSMFD